MKTLRHRFGMFVHWGIYALTGWQEQYALRHNAKRTDYEPLMHSFNPTHYAPDEWVKLAKDAGMEYICFTAKHHDGFCMWNTAETDFNVMNTPYGRDVLYELANACAKQNVALSIYYSNPDSHHPNGYNALSTHQLPPEDGDLPDSTLYREYVKAQLRELLTNYGDIYTLFWDIPPHIEDASLNDLARSLQPNILINDRGYSAGDFSTPERSTPDGESFASPTEACESVGRESWGYRANEDYYSPKRLMKSIDKIMLMGGSYLLNVGPDAEGRIPEPSQKIVRRVGDWYNAVRESYDDATPVNAEFACGASNGIYATRSGDAVYLHLNREVEASGFTLDCGVTPRSATLLNRLPDGESARLKVERAVMPSSHRDGKLGGDVLHIHGLPVESLYGEVPVVRLEF